MPSTPVPEDAQKKLVEIGESRIQRVHAIKPAEEIAFIIIKSENENTVIYQGKYQGEGEGRQLADPAVEVYWIDFKKDPEGKSQEWNAQKSGLNMIERNTAYGMTCKADGDGVSTVLMTALKEKPIKVKLGPDGRIMASTSCGGVEDTQLMMVYVQMKEKAWVPGVQHIDVVCKNPESGEYMFERITK